MGESDKQPLNSTISVQKTERNANFEALRILCMAMIVLYHCFGHGGSIHNVPILSFNGIAGNLIYAFLHVCVNCYVLISGYFLCESNFKAKRVINIWLTTFFWSVLLTLFSTAIGNTEFHLLSFLKSLFPVTQMQYWFVTSYCLMYLFAPFLNHAISHMTKKQHGTFLLMYFVVYIVIQNLSFWSPFSQINGNSPIFFVFLYMTAAYIRKYPPEKKINWGLLYIATVLFNFLWRTGVIAITVPLFGEPVGETAFTSYNSIFVYLGSVFLFLFFRNIEIRNTFLTKCIISVSSLTFGIYLIHDHNDIRSLLWGKLFPTREWVDDPLMLIKMLLVSTLIFAVCALLEYLRKWLWKLLRIDHAVAWLDKKLTVRWNQIVSCLFS